MEDEDPYMTMSYGRPNSHTLYSEAKRKPTQETRMDSITVFYCDDALEIVKLIDKKFSKYKVRVQCIRMDNVSEAIERNCGLLLLTPEMEPVLRQHKDPRYFQERFEDFDAGVVLFHERISSDGESLVDYIMTFCEDLSKWKKIQLDGTRIGFKKALLDLMAIVESPVSGPSLNLFTLIPKQISSSNEKVYIVFRRDVSGEVVVNVKGEDGQEVFMDTKRTSSCIFSFKAIGLTPGFKEISITVNGKESGAGKLTIRSGPETLGALLKDICNPIEYMAQCLQLQDREAESLDLELCDLMTAHGQNSPFQNQQDLQLMGCADFRRSKTEFPTLLHFAAKHGLRHFCQRLVQFPESVLAKNIKNRDNKTPSDLARLNGHIELASELLVTSSEEHVSPKYEDVVMRRKKASCTSIDYDKNYSTVSKSSSEWTERMTLLWNDDLDVPPVLSTKL